MPTIQILATSDTHDQPFAGELMSIAYSAGVTPDLIVHCGDATNCGTVGEVERFGMQLEELYRAFACPILFVPGNHDLLFERQPGLGEQILQDRVPGIQVSSKLGVITYAGIQILCNPYCPPVGNWAFCMTNKNLHAALSNAFIVPRVDLVVSHAPPLGILDSVGYSTEYLGYGALREKVVSRTPLLLCGHIHEHGGKRQVFRETTVINCAGAGMLCEINTKEIGNVEKGLHPGRNIRKRKVNSRP